MTDELWGWPIGKSKPPNGFIDGMVPVKSVVGRSGRRRSAAIQIFPLSSNSSHSRSMQVLKILGRENSINVRKVLWLCGELGLDFEREDWGRGFRSTSDPEFLAVNPIGLIPAVVDGEVVLRESNTILRYLASKYGPEAIYPTDLEQRARVEQWMDWVAYETSISLRGAFLGGQLNEPPWNNPWFVDQGRKQITREIGQLDEHLCSIGPYVTGSTFTIGDIPVGVVVNRWFHLDFERPDYPAVERYYALLDERAPYRQYIHNGMP